MATQQEKAKEIKERKIFTEESAENKLAEIGESRLAATYGHARENKAPGLKWLLGSTVNIPFYLDHYEYRIKDGKRTVDARPYGLGLNDLECLIELARKKNLHLYIQAPSNYNTSTIVVILTEIGA